MAYQSLVLLATNQSGQRLEFSLFARERQYTIGRIADISLQELCDEKLQAMYPIVAYITHIEDGWYLRAAKGFRRGSKAIFLNGTRINAQHPDFRLQEGFIITFGEKAKGNKSVI